MSSSCDPWGTNHGILALSSSSDNEGATVRPRRRKTLRPSRKSSSSSRFEPVPPAGSAEGRRPTVISRDPSLRSLQAALHLSERERLSQMDRIERFQTALVALQEQSLDFMERTLDRIEDLQRDRADLCALLARYESEQNDLVHRLQDGTRQWYDRDQEGAVQAPALILHRHHRRATMIIDPKRMSYRELRRIRDDLCNAFSVGLQWRQPDRDERQRFRAAIAEGLRHRRRERRPSSAPVEQRQPDSRMAALDERCMDALRLPVCAPGRVRSAPDGHVRDHVGESLLHKMQMIHVGSMTRTFQRRS